MESSLEPTPHTEALALIAGKPAVSRAVFDQMLPELRARVFTITGIECANTMERARAAIAGLPEGKTWKEAKEDLLKEISPYFDTEPTGEDGEGPSAAEKRAELLLRTHGFQAFNAANYRAIQEDEDTTHTQYLATEDGHARDSHIALNGIILPKNDPFWATHTPPWEWGCRCRIRPMNPDMVDEARAEDELRAPDNKLVIEGAALKKLREGHLMREGQAYDVTPPSEKREGGYQWHPDNLTIPISELRESYSPEDFAAFEAFAKENQIGGQSLWDWAQRPEFAPIEKRAGLARPEGVAPSIDPDPNAPKSGLEFNRQRIAIEKQLQEKEAKAEQRAEAAANFKPYELDPAAVRAAIKEVEAEIAANNPPEKISGEAIPNAPAEWRAEAEKRQREREAYQAAANEVRARSRLYYQADRAALEGIRLWEGRQIAALRQRYKQ